MNRFYTTYNVIFLFLIFAQLGCSKDDQPKTPQAALLNFPVNGETCKTGISINGSKATVEFSWNEASNASSYFLTIVNQQNGVQTKRAGIQTTDAAVELDRGFGYSWYITTVSETFPSDRPVSDSWQFYLQGEGESNGAPFTADLISPAAGEAITLADDGTYNLVWQGNDPDGDLLLYTLYIDTIDGLQTPTEHNTNISASNVTLDLNADSIYYWRVYSEDSFGNSTYSQVQSFRVLQ